MTPLLVTRGLAVTWTLAITVACLLPSQDLPELRFLPFSPDKFVHVGMFVGFGALWLAVAPRRAVAVAVAGVALGVGIEGLQGLLPVNRSPDPLDALADVVGLALGIGLARYVARRA